jgi:hypothetical protein
MDAGYSEEGTAHNAAHLMFWDENRQRTIVGTGTVECRSSARTPIRCRFLIRPSIVASQLFQLSSSRSDARICVRRTVSSHSSR